MDKLARLVKNALIIFLGAVVFFVVGWLVYFCLTCDKAITVLNQAAGM